MNRLLWIPIVGLGLAGGLFAGAWAFAPVAPERHLVSFAQFAGPSLEQCMDLLSVAKPGHVGIGAEIEANLANVKLSEGTIRLGKPCNEQLKDRGVVAKCVRQEARSKLMLTTTQRYYDASAVLDSDAAMKECLSLGGEWSAADRRDVAVEAARQSLRNLEAVGGL